MQNVLLALARAQGIDDGFHILAAGAVGHQHGVRRFDHDQVAHAHQGNQAAGGMDQCVAAVRGDDVAQMRVAGLVLGQRVPHGLPGAQVVPAGVQGHHANGEIAAGAMLHDRVVDRFGRYGFELGAAGAHELLVGAALVPCGARGLDDVGPKALQRGQPHRSLEHEHAGVPVVATFGQIGLCSLCVGLFDETRYGHVCRCRVAGCLGFYVAVAGFGTVRRDAQDDDGAIGSLAHGLLHGLSESGGVRHGLVGRGHDQHGVVSALLGGKRRQRESRGRVASNRLKQSRARLDAGFAQLLHGQKAVFFVADDVRRSHGQTLAGQAGQTVGGLLEQAFVARQA